MAMEFIPMKELAMKLEFDIACSHCGKSFKQRVDAMRPGHSTRCPSCGITIQFSGDDGRKVQKAVDDVEKTLSKLSKDLKLKL